MNHINKYLLTNAELPISTNPLDWGVVIDQCFYNGIEPFSITNNYVLYRKLIVYSMKLNDEIKKDYIYKVLSYDDDYGNNYHYTIMYSNGEIIAEFRDTICYNGPSIRIINHNLKYFSYETLN